MPDFIQLLSSGEEKIGKLYHLYAEKFPDYSKLWLFLENQEKKHAKILSDIKKESSEEKKHLKTSPNALGLITRVNDFVDSKLELAKDKDFLIKDALSSALRIERSMLEDKNHEMFKPVSLEAKKAFKRLNHETNSHIERLAKAHRQFIKTNSSK